MAAPILGLAGRFALAALKTPIKSTLIAGTAWMFKSEIGDGLKSAFTQVKQDPKKAIADAKAAVVGVGEKVDGALTTTRGVIDSVAGTGPKSDKPTPSLTDRALGFFGLGDSKPDGDDSGFSLGKLLKWGGMGFGAWWLLKKVLGIGGDNNSNSGSGIWSTLLMAGVAIGGAVLAFKNWDGIKSTFHQVTGNRFNSDTPSVAQQITGNVTGRPSGLWTPPVAPTSAADVTGRARDSAIQTDVNARAAMAKAAGRPITNTTVDSPPRITPETRPRTEIQVELEPSGVQ